MRRSLRLFREEQAEMWSKSEFEGEAGRVVQGGGGKEQCRGGAQVAEAAIVARRLMMRGGGRALVVVAGMAVVVHAVMVFHAGLCGHSLGVVVPAEGHAGRSESLQRQPQQQEAQYQFL